MDKLGADAGWLVIFKTTKDSPKSADKDKRSVYLRGGGRAIFCPRDANKYAIRLLLRINIQKGGGMDMISMALGAPRMPDPVSRVVLDAGSQMTDLAEKMLKVGLEVAVKGLEMGKGGLIDVVG